jgi:hypothetical protein
MESKRIVLIEKYQNIIHKRKVLIEKTLPRKTCLYFHINPIKQEIFYVGIGGYGRPYEKARTERSKFWHIITNKYNYQVIIVEQNLLWEEACEKEIYWIKRIGRRDLKEGTLVNLTDGGDGMRNLSKETIQKMSNSKKGKPSTKLIDLSGNIFGKLTVITRANNIGKKNNRAAWFCSCECGNKNIIISGSSLKNGMKNCGCSSGSWLESMYGNCFLQLQKGTLKILSAFDNIVKASKFTEIHNQILYKFFKGLDKHGGGYDWKIITKEEYNLYKEYHNISNFKYINGKTDKKLIAFLPDGSQKKFDSIVKAAKELNLHKSNISKCLQGERKHTGKIKFALC